MLKFQCWKFMVLLAPGHAQRRGDANAAETKTIRSVFVEKSVLSGRSLNENLFVATFFVKPAILGRGTVDAIRAPRITVGCAEMFSTFV